MLTAALTFFADSLVAVIEVAEEEESSKTPFYILGSAAAAWAIFLFAFGMRVESFPSSRGAQRGVIAISVLLVVGAMASSVLTS
jgi:hypothetical protein